MAGLATRTNTSNRTMYNKGHKIALNHIVLNTHKQKAGAVFASSFAAPSLQKLAGIASSRECRPWTECVRLSKQGLDDTEVTRPDEEKL